jgi:hypothetical protein
MGWIASWGELSSETAWILLWELLSPPEIVGKMKDRGAMRIGSEKKRDRPSIP